MINRPLLILLLLFSGICSSAHITDQLVVGVYDRPDASLKPVQALTSGAPVEVLKTRGEYSLVRLSDNSKGWVETRYLSDETPARAMLLALQAEKHALKQELAQLKKSAGTPTSKLALLSASQRNDIPRGIRLGAWHLPLLAILMLFSFFAGIVYKNYILTKTGS